MKVAIIGAGIAGAVCYKMLRSKNIDVTIFEKSRGAGGRCSTRYFDDIIIDHGTNDFQANSIEFQNFCDELTPHVLHKDDAKYYPKDGMNKLCSNLIDSKDLITQTKIQSCKFIHNKWHLESDTSKSYEGFDGLIITIPATQLLDLDIELSNTTKDSVANVKYNSIATLMLQGKAGKSLPQNFFESQLFKKVIDNASKYGYSHISSYLLHLDPLITQKLAIESKEDILKKVPQFLHKTLHYNIQENFSLHSHFWKYAFVTNKIASEYFFENKKSLGLCGDYFLFKDVEGSFLSAKSLCEEFA